MNTTKTFLIMTSVETGKTIHFGVQKLILECNIVKMIC